MNRLLEKSTLWFLATHFHFICFNLVLVQPTSHFSNTSSSHLCFKDESTALLELKNSFTVGNLSATLSWNEDIDCCKWKGITCHPTTHHVISLDLSNDGITGTIGNNSTLFQLYHLESLNLAFNYFSGSPISLKFGQFSGLKHLNLSDSFFSGDVPLEIGQLSKLETLDLSFNSMNMSSFDMIISNMTRLKRLDLGDTVFDSVVLPTLVNLSSLEYLSLFGCKLQEEVPFSLLNLPHLEYLEVGANTALYANFELYNWSSPLQYLGLHFVNFSNELPALPGQAPYKLLTVIHLSGCNFKGEVPSWMWSIPKLEQIVIGNNQLIGVPSKFLQEITSTKLFYLDLRSNNFTGNISLYKVYQKLPNLTSLLLSNNSLVVSIRAEGDPALTKWPMIVVLALSSCNLNEIPDLLKNQSSLYDLDFSNNDIHGEIPEWLLQEGKDTLEALDLSNNFITGSLETLPWKGLWFLDLSSNMFHGSLPIPPTTTTWFATANNNFTGAINSSICNISFLRLLDLSNNSLGGEFPKCLWNMSDDLQVLNLGSNNIVGTLPLNFTKCTSLQYLDLSNNGLQGSVSRSLADCTNLQVVNLRGNKLKDEFPLLLHNLPKIQVLDLSFNGLYGTIPHKIENPFLMLQILDLSSNNFVGEIPATYIKSFKAMMNVTMYTGDGLQYMGSTVSSIFRDGYTYSLVLTVSGVDRQYKKIISSLVTFDVSNNAFVGEIPDSIGDLVAIHSLNVSHNKIGGKIPSSIGNLKMINSLDLSVNRFTGKIPQELTILTYLGVFNVSNNQLVGPIPQANNFKTFEASSYQKNLGLCGFPLPECRQVSPDNEHNGFGNGGHLSISVWQITLFSYSFWAVLGLAWGYY